jgi:hypothetical protein
MSPLRVGVVSARAGVGALASEVVGLALRQRGPTLRDCFPNPFGCLGVSCLRIVQGGRRFGPQRGGESRCRRELGFEGAHEVIVALEEGFRWDELLELRDRSAEPTFARREICRVCQGGGEWREDATERRGVGLDAARVFVLVRRESDSRGSGLARAPASGDADRDKGSGGQTPADAMAHGLGRVVCTAQKPIWPTMTAYPGIGRLPLTTPCREGPNEKNGLRGSTPLESLALAAPMQAAPAWWPSCGSPGGQVIYGSVVEPTTTGIKQRRGLYR